MRETSTTAAGDVAIRGVRKVYPNGAVGLEDVSLDVESGSFFSILGPSGCGKSTLLRILAGLEVPTRGSVHIRGADVTDLAPDKRPTNLVFQRLALFPHLSVAKNIAFGPTVNGRKRAAVSTLVDEMLDLVDLGEYADRRPAELSGGQQQRVAIARALANRPAVLLLDEPLSALDLKLRTQMQIALKRIQRDSGTTFVYVTHDQGEAMTMSDRIAVMNAGRVEQVGSPTDVYTKPSTIFAATFLGETNILAGTARADHELEVGDLTLTLAAPADTVCVRPEHVDVLPTDTGPGPNTFRGTVADIAFRGSTVRYEVAVTTDVRIVSERPAGDPFLPAVGESVVIRWDPARTSSFTADTATTLVPTSEALS